MTNSFEMHFQKGFRKLKLYPKVCLIINQMIVNGMVLGSHKAADRKIAYNVVYYS